MAVYTSYDDICHADTLGSRDRLVFCVDGQELEYFSNGNHCYSATCNSEVFDRLGLDRNEKYQIASRYYGHETAGGLWPVAMGSAVELPRELWRLCAALFWRTEVGTWPEVDRLGKPMCSALELLLADDQALRAQ